MTRPFVVTAPAKLNLLLHIGGMRPDGYHDLQSLVAFTCFGDEIVLEHDEEISLSIDGPFGGQFLDGEDNLALKAAKLLAKETGTRQGVRISLRKHLPVASGLGGGSSDAAAVLRGLVGLWSCVVSRELMHSIGTSLGADVPVCIECSTSWMEGKGEHVRPLSPLPAGGVLLVNPGVAVSTAQVFATLGERSGLNASAPETPFRDMKALADFLRGTANDLERPAQTLAPIIKEVWQELMDTPDVLFARMSGSGATCFALYVDRETARGAASLLRRRHPKWWIVETAFSR